MSTAPFTIYLVDDDAGVLKALARLLAAHGYDVRAFTSGRDFLGAHDPTLPGCAVLDVAMPDLDGLQLQQALAEGGAGRPVIFVTGRGDIPTSVRAMKAGAGAGAGASVADMVGPPGCQCNSWWTTER